MRQTRSFWTLILSGSLCVTSVAMAQGSDPKAVQTAYASHRKIGVTYRVMLARGGNRTPVPTSFPFTNGDHVSLQLEVNQRSYVYVLNRTLQGDPETMASRDMRLDAEDDAKPNASSNPYTLLFPEAGGQYVVEAGRLQDVPPRGKTLTMVNPAGVEKLLVIVSPHPLDISTIFDPQTGRLSHRGSSVTTAGNSRDSDADVLNKLNMRLLAMEDNAEQARDIEIVAGTTTTSAKPPNPIENQNPSPVPPPVPVKKVAQPPAPVKQRTDSIGVAKQSDKPILVEISLKHGGV